MVAAVDETEQQLQRGVQVGAAFFGGGGRWAENLIAKPGEPVAVVILGGSHRQDVQLGGGFGEQQKQDAVQVAQRLAGQQLAVDAGGVQAAGAAPIQHIVGDDLDGFTHRPAQRLRNLHGVFAGVLQHLGPPRGAVGAALHLLEGCRGDNTLDFAAGAGVVAFDSEQQINGQRPAQRPGFTLREQQPPASEHNHERRWGVSEKNLANKLAEGQRHRFAVARNLPEGCGFAQVFDGVAYRCLDKHHAGRCPGLRGPGGLAAAPRGLAWAAIAEGCADERT